MLEKQRHLIPANKAFVEEIVNISRACNLNLWSAEDYVQEINRRESFNLVYFEKDKQKVIGFMFARLIKYPNISIHLTDSQNINNQLFNDNDELSEAEVLNIAVEPQHQKKGIGQIIFNSFLEFCTENQVEKIWLEVRESNLNARQFYQKNGFQISHTRKNYYREPSENALIMKLDVNLI